MVGRLRARSPMAAAEPMTAVSAMARQAMVAT